MQVQLMGIPWYREGDYAEILRIMADKHVLPLTHREWQQRAESLERKMQGQGVRVVRAVVDPKTFPAWCRRNGLNVDAQGRMAFANAEAYRVGRN